MSRVLRIQVVIDDHEPLEVGCSDVPEIYTIHDLISSLRDVADRLETWKRFRTITEQLGEAS